MSIMRKIKLWREINIIKRSGLFDEEWYRQTYLQDEKKKVKSELEHYCKHGWKGRLNPNADFDGCVYCKFFMNGKKSNPFIHYIKVGKARGYETKFYIDLERHMENLDESKKRILFVGHDFSLSGAPLAVFNTAVELKMRGFEVISLAFYPGPLTEKYSEKGISYFWSERYNGLTDLNEDDERRFDEILSKFDFVFCNTVLSCNIFKRIANRTPHLWRIAEGDDIKKVYALQYPMLEKTLSEADQLYAVSEYTRDYLLKYNPNVELLLYGFRDISKQYLGAYEFNKEKIKFCTIGYYSQRKAQDVILEAYKKLSKEVQRKIELIFVGTGFEKFEDEENIHFVGPKFDDEKYAILADCDVLLCPSLDDPNPQVVMEGMMMHKPCVVSDMVGQKNYITDGVDGFVVRAGNVEDLASLMKKMVVNPEILENMSEKSYDLYQKYFCFDKYLAKVISIIEEKL